MLVLFVLSVAASVGMTVFLLAELVGSKPREVTVRLSEIENVGEDPWNPARRRNRVRRVEQLNSILEALGERLQERYAGRGGKVTALLTHAGYRRPNALGMYWATRLVLAGVLAGAALLLLPLLQARAMVVFGAAVYAGGMGFTLPVLLVRSRKRARQKDLQLALADALDLMVVCVEAGLGLNQALLRVSEEIRHVSVLMSEELMLVNIEMRAGTARDVALTNLALRTGVEDLRSLTTMLIQTDRFGTSIAQSLRIHSDTLRMKRRQKAEEAAAKTTIKMVFPLVFCVFPAMFVVLIGPGLIQIIEAFRNIG